MSQMVLPQTSVPGSSNDIGAPKAGTGRDSGDGESRFESVSRAEQKRLDARRADDRRADERRAERNEQSRTAEKTEASERERATDKASAPAEGRPAGEAATAKNDGAGTAEQKSSEDPMLSGEEPPAEEVAEVPLTFAGLQALLAPVTTGTTGAEAVSRGAGAALNQFSQLNGSASAAPGGKPGQLGQPGQGAPGLTSGLPLTEALAGSLSAETSRPVDQSSLASAARFQSSFEIASQQAAGANRLPAEAAVPLKGYATSIDLPVSHGEWGDKVVGKLSWLTARNMSVAEIHLTPPDMGPMEVKVRVQNDQANITVHAANPVVRDQLELHSHRLRDMLSEQGLSLSQFDVSDSPQQQAGEQGAGDGSGDRAGAAADSLAAAEAEEGEGLTGSLDLSWKGEVDLFA